MAQAPTTARIRQRRRQRLLLMAVLLLALAGAAYYFMLRPDPRPKPEVRPPGMVAVPVTRVSIPLGTTVSARVLRLQYLPPLEVPPDALLKPFQFNKRVAMRNIEAGDYLRAEDLSDRNAPNGFSGLARPGTRVVVVETRNVRGTTGYLHVGDHVDVLAIGWSRGGSNGGDNRTTLEKNPATLQGGGTQPGDPNAKARQGPQAGGSGAGGHAVLLAEDAEVLSTPKQNRENQYVVLRMRPGDAHLTTLALGSGANLRFVFRPFNDEKRIVAAEPAEETTYVPRDARSVEVIAGAARMLQRAAMDD